MVLTKAKVRNKCISWSMTF